MLSKIIARKSSSLPFQTILPTIYTVYGSLQQYLQFGNKRSFEERSRHYHHHGLFKSFVGNWQHQPFQQCRQFCEQGHLGGCFQHHHHQLLSRYGHFRSCTALSRSVPCEKRLCQPNHGSKFSSFEPCESFDAQYKFQHLHPHKTQ